MRFTLRAAVIAVIIAVIAAASAGAASRYIITNTQQIKPSVRRALKGNVGPQGPRGVNGLSGAQGVAGPAGITEVFDVSGPQVTANPGDVVFSDAVCPAGSAIVGTGFYTSVANVAFAKRFGTFVRVAAYNDTSIVVTGIHAQAICAAGQGVSARSVVRPDTSAADAAVDAVRAAHHG